MPPFGQTQPEPEGEGDAVCTQDRAEKREEVSKDQQETPAQSPEVKASRQGPLRGA